MATSTGAQSRSWIAGVWTFSLLVLLAAFAWSAGNPAHPSAASA